MLIFDNLNRLKILNSFLRNVNGTALCNKHHDQEAASSIRTSASSAGKNNKKGKSQLQRFKKMVSQYWYVAIPVHIINSALWFGCCHYVSEQGFDVLKNLKEMEIHSKFTDFLTHSDLGQLTVSFALFKLLTPFRFATTLLGTTVAIQYLCRMGLIKPAKNPFKRKKKK